MVERIQTERIIMKRMLINATQSEELRVAIVDVNSQNLLDLIVERQSYKTKIGNIYLGKISSVEASLDAAFINFGSERHGFLPFKEIAPEYQNLTGRRADSTSLKDAIREGQSIMIQVEKEERGSKGAALTSFISLAGSYLVLMPNNPGAGGISRRVEGEERDELREVLNNLEIPEGMGIIVRTAGVGKNLAELQWDLNTLLKQWDAIKKATEEREPPFLIHQESDIVIRTIRDYLRQDITEILVDSPDLFEKIKQHLEQIRPDFLNAVKLYSGNIPLFNRYQIEHQIESAYQREVRLPSGGAIVIDHTEALVAIDVNSARSTKGSDIEETALKTNMEAAEKIACQLRLRDLGGLIVIDFIDMASVRHRREVENHLRNSLKLDKARTQIGAISQRFGLLEMSRQRLRPSLGEATQVVCPRCSGWGTIRGVESLALSVIRMIEEDAVKPNTSQIQVQLPVDVATFIVNEKRQLLTNIEKNRSVEIVIIPNPNLDSPRYAIKRMTENETSAKGKGKPSYELVEAQEIETHFKKTGPMQKTEEKPAVAQITPSERIPQSKKPTTGLIKRFLTGLFGTAEEETKAVTPTTEETKVIPPVVEQQPQPRAKTPGSPQKGRGTPRQERQRTITPTSSTRNPRRDTRKQQIAPEIPAEKAEKIDKVAKIEKVEPVEKVEKIATEKPQTEQAITENKHRTRRGSRGGRRRPSHGPKPQGQGPKLPTENLPLEEPPADLLPPFPSDLEDYYKENVGNKTRKPGPTAPTGKVSEEKGNQAPVEQPKPEPIKAEAPKPSMETAAAETAKPIIVRPQAIQEVSTEKPKEADVDAKASSDDQDK